MLGCAGLTEPTCSVLLNHDADSHVLSRHTRAGATITYGYDTLNRLSTKAAPSEATVTYAHDLSLRLIGASDTSAAIATPTPGGMLATISYSYDSLNHLTGSNWGPAPAQTLGTPASVTFNFTYDGTNRRISQTTTDTSYWFMPTTASSITYTANNLDQYTAVGSVAPTYDGHGNLTYDGTYSYRYDAENRLISASGAGTSASYAYDALGRRKQKTVNGSATNYVQTPDGRALLDYAGSGGAISAWYAFGAGPNDVLNQVNVAGSTRATYVPDVQGSIIAAVDAGSGVVTNAGYQPYGESGTTVGTFRYSGARIDVETNGLYDFRARIYSPPLGRFMQPDPIGSSGGINLYAYVNNDPLNNIDALGLWQVTISGGLGFGGAVTFGYNSGQWSVGAYIGPAIGANISVNPANAATTRPGVYTGFVGSASAEVGPIAVDVGGSAQTTTPQGRIMNFGTASVEAAANFGAYSVGGEATINPNGSVSVASKVTGGLGTSAYGAWGATYQSTPSQPSSSPSASQPNSSSGLATTGSGATK